jgi:hypothetical protein
VAPLKETEKPVTQKNSADLPTSPESHDPMLEVVARIETKLDSFTTIAQNCFNQIMVERKERLESEKRLVLAQKKLARRISKLEVAVGIE